MRNGECEKGYNPWATFHLRSLPHFVMF
jgi:hypothetical protein